MEPKLMNLKILLPYRVFAQVQNVTRIVAETNEGAYGLWPQRLDCVAALVPGIFIYQTQTGNEKYVAVDEGLLIKAGAEVLVSVRNAIGGADLGQLRLSVEKEFKTLNDAERNVRQVMAKLENGFIQGFETFRKS